MLRIKENINLKELENIGFIKTRIGYSMKTNTYNKESGDFAFSRYLDVIDNFVSSRIENGISDEIWTNYDLRIDHVPVDMRNLIEEVVEEEVNE